MKLGNVELGVWCFCQGFYSDLNHDGLAYDHLVENKDDFHLVRISLWVRVAELHIIRSWIKEEANALGSS